MSWVYGRPLRLDWCSTAEEDYEDATRKLVQRSKKDGVAGIYQIGRVNVPGVSDVDLVFVFESVPKNISEYTIASYLESETPYFVHDPIFIDLRLYERFGCLFPVSEITRRWVRESASLPDFANGQSSRDWKLAQALQWLLTKVPGSLFSRCVEVPAVNVRSLLNNIYSFRHTLALCDAVAGVSSSAWEAEFDELNRFRHRVVTLSWLDLVDELESWCHRVLCLVYRVVEAVEGPPSDCDDGVAGEYIHYDPNGLNVLFLRGWSVERALWLTYFFKDSGARVPTILPIRFADYLSRVGSMNETRLGRSVAGRLAEAAGMRGQYRAPNDSFQAAVEEQVGLCEQYFDLNREMRYSGMPFLQFGLSAAPVSAARRMRGVARRLVKRGSPGPMPPSISTVRLGLGLAGD